MRIVSPGIKPDTPALLAWSHWPQFAECRLRCLPRGPLALGRLMGATKETTPPQEAGTWG